MHSESMDPSSGHEIHQKALLYYCVPQAVPEQFKDQAGEAYVRSLINAAHVRLYNAHLPCEPHAVIKQAMPSQGMMP